MSLAFCLLFSTVLGAEYNYKLLDTYRSSVIDVRWNYYYDTTDSNLTLDYVIPTREPSNNRFVASFDCGSSSNPSFRKNIHRFDLIVRFNGDYQVYKGDNFSLYFWLSSQCQFYNIDSLINPSYTLHFVEVWFGDVKISIYPERHWFQSDGTVNDQPYTLEFGTMTQNLGSITSVHFAFITSAGVNASEYPYGPLVEQPWFNIWFGNSLTAIINRDTSQNPIYIPPNDNGIINDHNRVEDQIDNGIQDGLNDSQNMFQNFGDTFLSNDSRIYRGLLFVTNTLNRFFHIEIFTTLGQFALSLGLFAFLVGIVQLVKSSIERHNNNNNNRNGGSG